LISELISKLEEKKKSALEVSDKEKEEAEAKKKELVTMVIF
jgi:hypothetical protein